MVGSKKMVRSSINPTDHYIHINGSVYEGETNDGVPHGKGI